jgi:hypothetical protein
MYTKRCDKRFFCVSLQVESWTCGYALDAFKYWSALSNGVVPDKESDCPESVMEPMYLTISLTQGVGAAVGAFVGDLVGALDGAFVGLFVGVFVGLFVGVFTGLFVSVLVGTFVSLFVGAVSGDKVGTRVSGLLGVFVDGLVRCTGVLVGTWVLTVLGWVAVGVVGDREGVVFAGRCADGAECDGEETGATTRGARLVVVGLTMGAAAATAVGGETGTATATGDANGVEATDSEHFPHCHPRFKKKDGFVSRQNCKHATTPALFLCMSVPLTDKIVQPACLVHCPHNERDVVIGWRIALSGGTLVAAKA